MDIYQLALAKADEIETELKRLARWAQHPLADEAYQDMGAFGSNTMSFENWLQFVLLPRIREIASEHEDFPPSSHLASYAIRYFDGDYEADPLRALLHQLDDLINNQQAAISIQEQNAAPTVTMGDTTIPDVLYSVAEVLSQFELDALESQLQTFDTFLRILSPTVRPAISAMLMKAAMRTSQPDCKKRIEKAASDVAEGKFTTPFRE
jgi:uncharacterized protein YqcC (DUF446 family)